MGQVFPILGGVLATIMYASPVKATFMARKNGALGVGPWRTDSAFLACSLPKHHIESH